LILESSHNWADASTRSRPTTRFSLRPALQSIASDDDEDLPLLIPRGGKVVEPAIAGVVLDSATDDSAKVTPVLGAGRKAKPLIDIGAMQGAFEDRVDGDLPPADADPDRPDPGFGHIYAGPDAIADPIARRGRPVAGI